MCRPGWGECCQDALGIFQNIGVREHYALGAASGTGGIHQRGKLLRVKLDGRYLHIGGRIKPLVQGDDVDIAVIFPVFFRDDVVGYDHRFQMRQRIGLADIFPFQILRRD